MAAVVVVVVVLVVVVVVVVVVPAPEQQIPNEVMVNVAVPATREFLCIHSPAPTTFGPIG